MRAYCEQCHYPINTCVCEHIKSISIPLNVIIIQHPKEATHAKNTARLVAMSIPSACIVLSNDVDAMHKLAQSSCEQTTALIYPSENSVALEDLSKEKKQQYEKLILIDGSWKQAYGIVKQSLWLQSLPAYHFSNAAPSQYAIRHTSLPHALSTLEAAAHSISCLCEADMSALYTLQTAMQEHWQGPVSHRRNT